MDLCLKLTSLVVEMYSETASPILSKSSWTFEQTDLHETC